MLYISACGYVSLFHYLHNIEERTVTETMPIQRKYVLCYQFFFIARKYSSLYFFLCTTFPIWRYDSDFYIDRNQVNRSFYIQLRLYTRYVYCNAMRYVYEYGKLSVHPGYLPSTKHIYIKSHWCFQHKKKRKEKVTVRLFFSPLFLCYELCMRILCIGYVHTKKWNI